MLKIEFYDREKEIQEIMNILNTRPDMITFVYGPINSGKTELIGYLVNLLPKTYRVFYINLRGVYVSKAEDFLKVLFDVRGRSIKDCIKFALDLLPSEVTTPKGRIPIPKQQLKQIFEKKELENVFIYLENFFNEVAKKKRPVFILDELQVIKDVEVDGLLIYKLFNFFVRLTKELHLCHVFVVTSDSLFIEKVYNEAMLQGRCRYLLVDDFDYNTTAGFLKKYGFDEDEVKLVWSYLGGKPIYLVEAVKNKYRLKEFCEELLEERFSVILYSLKRLKRENERLFNRAIGLFKQFKGVEVVECDEINEEVEWTIKQNILFLNPRRRLLKPQSKLDLLAVRRVLESLT